MNQLVARILVVSMIALGFHCSSSNDDPQPVVTSPAPPCLIKGFGSMYGSIPLKFDTAIYSYNNSRIEEVMYGTKLGQDTKSYTYKKFNYSYYKDRLPSVIQSNKGDKFEFSYNSQDQLITVRVTLGNQFDHQDDISYDDTGSIKRLIRSDQFGDISEKLSYTYSNENPSEVIDSLYDGKNLFAVSTINYSVNARLALPFHLPILLDPSRYDYTGFKNYVTKITQTGLGYPVLQFKSLSFNDKGYPIQLTGEKVQKFYSEQYVFDCQ